MAPITSPCRSFSISNCFPARFSIGYSWPALAAVSRPVESSRIPSQTVTNISSGLRAQIWSFAVCNILAGLYSPEDEFRIRADETIINSAAGIPFPETSAITIPRWSLSIMKKS